VQTPIPEREVQLAQHTEYVGCSRWARRTWSMSGRDCDGSLARIPECSPCVDHRKHPGQQHSGRWIRIGGCPRKLKIPSSRTHQHRDCSGSFRHRCAQHERSCYHSRSGPDRSWWCHSCCCFGDDQRYHPMLGVAGTCVFFPNQKDLDTP